MQFIHPDTQVAEDQWSDLSRFHALPEINLQRLYDYRLERIREQMRLRKVDLCVLVNPVSQRYVVDYRGYSLFCTHIPSTYIFVAQEGSCALFNATNPEAGTASLRKGRPIGHFYGGDNLAEFARLFADDVKAFLIEMGEGGRHIAIEYVNPSLVQALEQKGFQVSDGVQISEHARKIKNQDEIDCIKWSIRVAEHGADRLKQVLQPGVSELQLWGLLNYTNLANNGDWHDGRMLASGSRINPWLQEASPRKVESGDLVGFDTDMVGPMGYFADLSRTFLCGPAKATKRQKQLYRLALDEIEHNLAILKPGIRYSEYRTLAWPVPEEFQQNAYPCVLHGVGMCDEFPHINQPFREPLDCDGVFEVGMVVCIESYIGAVGERDGVKLEQQVLITDQGYELLTTYPFEEKLLD